MLAHSWGRTERRGLNHRSTMRTMKTGLTLFAVLALSCALAQADDIVFDVETFRVGSEGALMPTEDAMPGDIVEYQVTMTHIGEVIYRPGTVVVTLPIGSGFSYIDGTATASLELVTTAFSADAGKTFSEPPVRVGGRIVEASEYDAIRWTVERLFEPGESEMLSYRVQVEDTYAHGVDSGSRTTTEGFRFDRVDVFDAGAGFAQVVGEVVSQRRFESATLRITLFDRSGRILGTERFIVRAVGPSPRIFDVLVPRVDVSAVADYSFQVESTR